MKPILRVSLIAACATSAWLTISWGMSQAITRHPTGLVVGTPAPAFQAHDQFGQEQDNKTLAGKNGTVLLFFRSADW